MFVLISEKKLRKWLLCYTTYCLIRLKHQLMLMHPRVAELAVSYAACPTILFLQTARGHSC